MHALCCPPPLWGGQALSNLAWAMASVGYYHPAFLSGLVAECLARGLERLSPQNLSNVLWSCATLGHGEPRMLSAWAAATADKLGAFEPQGISNRCAPGGAAAVWAGRGRSMAASYPGRQVLPMCRPNVSRARMHSLACRSCWW